jgi:adenylosuccinate synthase
MSAPQETKNGSSSGSPAPVDVDRQVLADLGPGLQEGAGDEAELVAAGEERDQAADGQVADARLQHLVGAAPAGLQEAAALLDPGQERVPHVPLGLADTPVGGVHLDLDAGPGLAGQGDEVQGGDDVGADPGLEPGDVAVVEVQPPGERLEGPGVGHDQAVETQVLAQPGRLGQRPAQLALLVEEVGVDDAAADGLVLDSVVFLQLAFGSLEFLPGQLLGKASMTVVALPLLALARRAVLPPPGPAGEDVGSPRTTREIGAAETMPGTILVGSQWGDEGKGKATDLLADKMDVVVRYQGGNNAGHTVIVGGRTFKLHLVPSGILYPHVTPVIGNGMVVDPGTLLAELAALDAQGIATGKLLISANAHLIMPWHKELDKLTERWLGRQRIGTTGRGIGPTYADKAARLGIRVQDLLDLGILAKKVEAVLRERNPLLAKVYNRLPLDAEAIVEEYATFAEALRPRIADTSLYVWNALREGKQVLFEGAQATLLDVDHGTYPFVTSSSPVAGGALAGAGVGPGWIDRVMGIAKAYVTRVGAGPFPTEAPDAEAEVLRAAGDEFGTTTGRPRRCGWLDTVGLRYAARVNGLTELFVTKLDVLSRLERVPVAVAYRIDGEVTEDWPMTQTEIHHAEPVYELFEGWREDISGVTRLEDLPRAARAYVDAIEKLGGVPVTAVGVGPGREQTMTVQPARSASAAAPPARATMTTGGE